MGLDKKLEELEKDILKEDGKAVEPAETDEPEADAPDDKSKTDDEPAEITDTADEAETEVEAKDTKPTNTDSARLRRENAALKKQLKDVQAKATPEEKKEAKVEATTAGDPEPDKAVNPTAHLEWQVRDQRRELDALKGQLTQKDPDVEEIKRERLIDQAEKEFDGFATTARKDMPDVDAAINHVVASVYDGFRKTNPRDTHEQLQRKTRLHVLMQARDLMKDGHDNPVAALYDMAHEVYGYTKAEEKAEEADTADEKAKPRTDLKKIEASKKKSVSPLNTGGRNGKSKSLPVDIPANLAEFEKLSDAEVNEILTAA